LKEEIKIMVTEVGVWNGYMKNIIKLKVMVKVKLMCFFISMQVGRERM
jgi:hypothetical protein